LKLFNQKEAETQTLYAWWAAAGAKSEVRKSLTHVRGLGSPNNKEGILGHSETADIVTVLVNSFD
jgi:hypothetical protein